MHLAAGQVAGTVLGLNLRSALDIEHFAVSAARMRFLRPECGLTSVDMHGRGRKERIAFASTFEPAYHFRLLYLPGSFYPIMGALRYCAGQPWQARRTPPCHALRTPPGALSRDLAW